jgi:glycosyltransferase involved in cell wall biosynthesis
VSLIRLHSNHLTNTKFGNEGFNTAKMKRKRNIGVDLTSLPVNFHEEESKRAIVTLLTWIQTEKSEELRFIYFCNSQTQLQIRKFCRKESITICINELHESHSIRPILLSKNDFYRIGQQNSILNEFPVDYIYSPLGDTKLFRLGAPIISAIEDLLHKEHPDSLAPEEVKYRDKQAESIISKSSYIQTSSNYTKKRLLHDYSLSEERVFVIPYTIAERLSDKRNCECSIIDGPYFFYPEDFWKHRNHETLLVAYYNYIEQTASPPWKLVLTGQSGDRKLQVKEDIRALQLCEHVILIENITFKALEACRQNANALVFPSLYEESGAALFNAMQNDIPIICHNSASLKEFGEEACLTCDCRNPLLLASSMNELAENDPLRSELVSKGKSRISNSNIIEIAERLSTKLIEEPQSGHTALEKLDVLDVNFSAKEYMINLPENIGRSYIELKISATQAPGYISIYLDEIPLGSYDIVHNENTLISFFAYLNGNELKIEYHKPYNKGSTKPTDLCVNIHSVKITPKPESIHFQKIHPKISIIIPSFNQGQFLKACIDSILSQKIPGTEIIVFDGGSTDETIEILNTYGEKIYWESKIDRGQTDAINKGLQRSTGDILAYLNSDDTYYPNAFIRVLRHFSENPDCLAIYGKCNHLKENGDFLESYNTQPWDYEKLQYECFICQPGTFWRRELIERYGLFDDRLNYCMDYEYWLRVGNHHAFHFLDDSIFAGSRLYDNNKTLSQKGAVHKEIVSVVYPINIEAGFHWLQICADHKFKESVPGAKEQIKFGRLHSYHLVKNILAIGNELHFPFCLHHLEKLKAYLDPHYK